MWPNKNKAAILHGQKSVVESVRYTECNIDGLGSLLGTCYTAQGKWPFGYFHFFNIA